MLNLEVLKEDNRLIKSIRRNLGLDEDDESRDQDISKMEKHEALERFLNWNNIIGYASIVIRIIKALDSSVSSNGKISHDELSANDEDGIIEQLRRRGQYPDFDDANFDDKKFNDYINSFTAESAFDEVMSWKGLIGYGPMILSTYRKIETAAE